uniref:Uncharacterized protein n=1 Tax=Amphilophus citrinellus TaxID=61819 RepID=A0A3Q0RNP2_AMPCI
MKCLVMVFLVLSLVVLMAEPGECFFKHIKSIWKGFKAAVKGAKNAWKGKSQVIMDPVMTLKKTDKNDRPP